MKGKRIIFLATTSAIATGLKELIEDRGSTVVACEKATEALEYVRKGLADALIVDPVDKRSGGALTIARAKQLNAGLPVLAITDRLTEAARDEAFGAGTDAIFTTPLSEDSAYAMLIQALTPAPAPRAARR